LSGEHEGKAYSCIPILLIVLLALASLPLVHVASPSFEGAERTPADSSESPLNHIDDHGFSANSNETRRYSLGALHEKIPEKSRARLALAKGLPTHFDWRDYAGQNWMTSIKDQGGCGSCVAFGAVAAVEGQFKIQANNPAWDIDLSEAHLFSCGGGNCVYGWWVSSALNYLQTYGTPDEACSPYQAGNLRCSNSCPNWQSRAFRISSWSWVAPDTGSIQAALQNGPLVAAFDVYTDFFYYTNGVYRHTWGYLEGGHAVAIVGYDSIEQYWIVKNSWGSGWGESGYFKIAFGQVGIEQEVASVRVSIVTATATLTQTQASTAYPYGTTTRTSTSYTGTSTVTSTVPTVTTLALLLMSVTTIVQSIQYLTSILTATATSYVATQISTSTTVVPVTVTVTPSTTTSTVGTTQVVIETGTTIVTSYRTSTITSYTGTRTATSTTPSLTTVALVPSTVTSTAQSTELVTSVTSATMTSYTTTTTATSTTVVYTTVTQPQAGAGAPNPLAYLGFISLLAVTVGHRITAGKPPRIPRTRSLTEGRCSRD